jgi:hypothetical protein
MNMWGAANHPILAAVIGVLWLMAAVAIFAILAAVLVCYFAYWSGPEAWRILARYRYDALHSAVT